MTWPLPARPTRPAHDRLSRAAVARPARRLARLLAVLALVAVVAGLTPVAVAEPAAARAPTSASASASLTPAPMRLPSGPVVAKQRANASQPWVLTWADEFTGAAGTKPDPTRWVSDVGGRGWGNQQLEYDTADTRNVSVDGRGRLAITATTVTDGRTCWYGTCRYTSGRITTKGRFSQEYGRLEAAMMIPCGAGLWPAFWALGTTIDTVGWPGSGEIDVMEIIGTEPYTVHGTVHGPGYSGSDAISATTTTAARLCDGFHVFSATWTPMSITFSVDGRTYSTATSSQTRGNPWVFGHPFFLLLDLAVGGSWPGSPTSATHFPATLLVDWVRVYCAC